ncbi:uncharacterized protein LOC113555179 [Rhopalosiphum maidis]|uniref:uncharacterized protein LOC113555179 n=1 Tax=Rhopalosiphum maidis TaxID=43146 RepID=UPI000F00175F|nr:uncharacterized protein LOC113555179 [Rhopalosiphum maidis]
MGGSNECVQIDDSLLRGKRKYNRGRILLGDHRGANLTDDDSSDSDSENIPPNNRNRNYCKRVERPWVFGMCWRHDGFLEKRFFVVERRDRATLIPIIEKEILPGT